MSISPNWITEEDSFFFLSGPTLQCAPHRSQANFNNYIGRALFFVKSFGISRLHLESDLNFLTWLTFVLMPLIPFLELQCGYCLSDCAPLPNLAQAVPVQP